MTTIDVIAGLVAVPLARGWGTEGFGYDQFSISTPDPVRFGTGHADDVVDLRTSKDRFILPLPVLEQMIETYRQGSGL